MVESIGELSLREKKIMFISGEVIWMGARTWIYFTKN